MGAVPALGLFFVGLFVGSFFYLRALDRTEPPEIRLSDVEETLAEWEGKSFKGQYDLEEWRKRIFEPEEDRELEKQVSGVTITRYR